MLYIFDLGNVVIDIDFNRVIGVWSNLSGVPLATLTEKFNQGDAVARYDRGELSDQEFADEMSRQLAVGLSFEQFITGWQAIFVSLKEEVLNIIQKLQNQGERVVILSNTNELHYTWLQKHYPQIEETVPHMYLSYKMGCRKPEEAIYRMVLEKEQATADQSVFFDDLDMNVQAAKKIGINAIQFINEETLLNYLQEKNILLD